MPHYVFEQPNGYYGVWSTVLDAPIKINYESLEELIYHEANYYTDIDRFLQNNPIYSYEDVINKDSINCSLEGGNMTVEEWLKYLKDIDYVGPLYEFVETWEKCSDE